MYGFRKHSGYYFWKGKYMSIVMELAGRNLNTYYDRNSLIIRRHDGNREIFSDERKVVLENILKCAAKALQQFHNFGVHNDIRSNNFVTLKEQDELEPLTSCKLIDFNLSKTIGQDNVTNDMEVNRKRDIWALGSMMLTMMKFRFQNFPINLSYDTSPNFLHSYISNVNYNTNIDTVLKGCLLENANLRPSMSAIVNFLEGNCHRFIYETQNSVGTLCED
uniref:non-specific serine/threonine protein kinase n=1 Tax=Meloidogyne enterolobii TaxID=390850 RepID=A0A6V7U8E0_MELEN|nr:unnamed protein product [Meloidogyne enterolobii]